MGNYIMSKSDEKRLYDTCKFVRDYITLYTQARHYNGTAVAEFNNSELDALGVGLVFFFDTREEIDFEYDRIALEIRSFDEENFVSEDIYGDDIFDVHKIHDTAVALITQYIDEFSSPDA